ncbi:MAG TPA: nucleoside-diphosphate kinase [Candidatus Nanoarchaeia archaeon]|nr:nucleoside-diphosphate kinase [Candidatus Nanoarchaeia archaeon]
MANEQCLVIIKPDGMAKGLAGDVVRELSTTDLKMVGSKVAQVTKELAEEHYSHLKDKEFFNELIKYIMGHFHHVGSVLALVYEGENATAKIRNICGATHPEKAEPTTIRGKFGRVHSQTGVFENVIHASENAKEAEREIKLWFKPYELIHNIYPIKRRKEEMETYSWK